jgi:hypothetical protein
MVAIARRHDMRSSIFTESAQSWSVRTQIGGHCSHRTARLKWRAMRHWTQRWTLHWSTTLLRQLHAAFQLALFLALALLLTFPLALSLLFFARALLGLAPHLLHQVRALLSQLGALQRHEVQVAARARVEAAVQVFVEPGRLTGMAGHIYHLGRGRGAASRGHRTLRGLILLSWLLFDLRGV